MHMSKRDFLDEMQYIDGITIIDTSGNILFSVKFNPAFQSENKAISSVIGKKLYEAFPNIDEKSSTLIKAMEFGMPIYSKKQDVVDILGNKIFTRNISIPIKANERIIGAIEISKDLSAKSGKSSDIIEINPKIFKSLRPVEERLYSNKAKYTLDDIISGNKEIRELKEFIRKIGESSAPVFIYGETGTGKELFAHALHNASKRTDKPFIAQNCAAIPENLLESILFGTTKGSFTGAYDNPGLFELADGGSIFLDEINSMPIHLQSKLLRVLQDGFVRRLGDRTERRTDVRIISAANVHPRECLKKGQLRQDIYYRLSVLTMNIPPLRERREDIQVLLNYFINKYNALLKKNIIKVSKEVFQCFIEYPWPGNVREMEHLVEYAMNIVDDSDDTIRLEHIESRMESMNEESTLASADDIVPLGDAVAAVEKDLIARAVSLTSGNVSKAAKLLKIPRQTLQRKILQYNITAKNRP